MKYEICYLVGELNEARLSEIKVGAEKIITDEGGVFEGIETQDRRKLAYKVEKDIRGVYVTRRFELPEREDGDDKNPIGEMTKKLNLFGDVLRFLIIKAEKLPELKQREIVAKTAPKGERRFERSRSATPAPVRREATPKVEEKAPEVKVVEEKIAEAEVKAKEESIDQKLDELLNI